MGLKMLIQYNNKIPRSGASDGRSFCMMNQLFHSYLPTWLKCVSGYFKDANLNS